MKELIPFAASARQREVLNAVIEHGSNTKGAAALGMARRTVDRVMMRIKDQAARRGYSPEHGLEHPTAPGQRLKGTSTLYKDGVKVIQWVKTTPDQEKLDEMQKAAIEALCEDIPRVSAIPAPNVAMPSLCNVYTLTDSHVGMLAWHKEGGADWDLKIAEETLVGCFAASMKAAPTSETCVIAELGDWMHYDGLTAVTPTSGHPLDADGRFGKMVKVAVRVLRRVVDMALAKHRKVILVIAEGNHDMASSVWMRAVFGAVYENEPRLEIIDSELPYYTYQHGETMLAWHHGHLQKNSQLPLMLAAQFPKVWGGTTKRYCHTGHRHHVEEKEYSGMTVVQHPTLAARDAYAARGGWIAERQVTAITYSNKYGEVARNTVTPEML